MKRIILLILLVFPVQAATYYVATTGNDTTGDGSSGNPWATVTKAKTVAVAGDVVNVATGFYDERITNTVSGTEGSVISFVGPTDRSATNYGFYLNAASYVVIKGFTCSNYLSSPTTFSYNHADILVRGHHNTIASNNCFGLVGNGIAALDSGGSQAAYFNTIQANTCYSNHTVGIYSSGTNATVIGNEVAYVGTSNLVNTNYASNADGIWVFTKNGVIASNYVHGLYLQGAVPHIDGLQTWEDGPSTPRNGIKDSIICNNTFDCPENTAIMLQSVSNNLIYNNVFRSHIIATISYDTDGTTNLPWSDHPPCKQLFYNNTFIVQSNATAQALGISMGCVIINEWTNGFGNVFTNNLFVGTHAGVRFISVHDGANNPGNATGNYNLFYATNGNLSIAPLGYSYSANDVTNSNPLLVAPFDTTLNYQTSSGSPAINAATPLTSVFTRDILNVTRGSQWDIGAYEYQTPVTALPPVRFRWKPL